MTLVTLRPNSTAVNTGALTGGATAHAVLADDSDASYVTFDPAEAVEIGFADLTLPAGAVVFRATLRTRTSAPTGSVFQIVYRDLAGPTNGASGENVTWASPTTTSPVAGSSGLSDAQVDAYVARIERFS